MTTQSSDHPNGFKELDIPYLKIYTKYMASFVGAKISSYWDSGGKKSLVQKVTLYRYRYIGGPKSITRFPINVRYCLVFSIFNLDIIITKIIEQRKAEEIKAVEESENNLNKNKLNESITGETGEKSIDPNITIIKELSPKGEPFSCTILNGGKAIIIPFDDFIKTHYTFFADVYLMRGKSDIHGSARKDILKGNIYENMNGEWMNVAIDADNNEFEDKCLFLNLDFPNIVLYNRSKYNPDNLDELLIEAVPEVARIYKIFKKTRENTIEEKEIKKGLKLYFNSQKSSFNLVTEKILNNDFIYSLTNTNHDRRDFCGRLLLKIAETHGYSKFGSQNLFKKMLKIEAANKKKI